MRIVEQSALLLAMTPEPCNLIERCGRVCYKSESKMASGKGATFIHGLIRRGHTSVLEHASATFLLVTDRGITHELVRHRLCAFSQESTRYCNYGNKNGGITVIRPKVFEPDSPEYTDWFSVCTKAEEEYLELIDRGKEPQWARSVLPTCLKTEIAVTANFRQWRHMLGLRLLDSAGKAHPQIKELFEMILGILLRSNAAPVFQDMEARPIAGGGHMYIPDKEA